MELDAFIAELESGLADAERESKEFFCVDVQGKPKGCRMSVVKGLAGQVTRVGNDNEPATVLLCNSDVRRWISKHKTAVMAS